MKNNVLIVIFLACLSSAAYGKAVYLSCPNLDKRAVDLKVILDEANGSASLQSPSSGSGLNFTSSASFGPSEVLWRHDSKSLKQTFSVDRTTLVLQRKTFSELTRDTYIEKADCSLIKGNKSAKF